MRPFGLADVEIAARMLACHPARDHPALLKKLIRDAEKADQFRLKTGRQHVEFGSGTLMSAATKHQIAPRFGNITSAECDTFICIFKCLRDWMHHQNT